MIAETEILKMSVRERLDTIELIWSTLREQDIESPDWHADVLAERRRRLDSGEEVSYSLEEAWVKLEEIKVRHKA